MQFFLDANIPYRALEIIHEMNIKAIHARDAGLGMADDNEIFTFAVKNNFVLITKDLEFANRKLFPHHHCGMIIIRLPFFFKSEQFCRILKDFLNTFNTFRKEDLQDTVAIVKAGHFRIRKLH